MFIKAYFIFSSLPSILHSRKRVRLLWILPQRKRSQFWRSPTQMRKDRCCNSLSEKQDGIKHSGKSFRCLIDQFEKAQFIHTKLNSAKRIVWKYGNTPFCWIEFSFCLNLTFLNLRFPVVSLYLAFTCWFDLFSF